MSTFFDELKRRNVFRVASAYAITGWVIMQVADVMFPALLLPKWALTLVAGALILGFPITLILSWAYELTPEGIKRETEVDRTKSLTAYTGRKLDFFIIGALLVAVSFLLVDKFVLQETEDVVIAVLPLDNLSTNPEHAFFTEGMHDDLLTQLSRVGAWSVISRTSVERFRDTTLSVQEIGKLLNTKNIVEGSVQRFGNRLRINVQLIDAANDRHLWAETYDRELTATNIFSIQSEITQAIATELEKALTPEEERRITTAHSQNLEAYQAYLLGRDRWRKRTAVGVEEAITLFEKAIELDPEYALAYSGLADAYLFQTFYSALPHPEEQYRMAKAAIQKGLSLTEQLGEIFASQGLLNHHLGQPVEAELAFKRALVLNPSYTMTLNWYGILLTDQGRSEESLTLYLRGLELEPLSVILHYNAGVGLGYLGRHEEGLAFYQKAIAINPDATQGYWGTSQYYRVQGRLDAALRWRIKAAEINSSRSVVRSAVAETYLSLGDDAMAEKWLALTQRTRPDLVSDISVLLALYRKENELAVELARRVVSQRLGRFSLAVLRDNDLAKGRVDDARARYARHYPKILGAQEPRAVERNPDHAIDIAYYLLKAGSEAEAMSILKHVHAGLDTLPQFGERVPPMARVRLLILQGRDEDALAKLSMQAGVTVGGTILTTILFSIPCVMNLNFWLSETRLLQTWLHSLLT